MFGADLAAVVSFVGRFYVLNDEAPLGRSLVVVDADPRVRSKLEQADSQRMDIVPFPPRHLLTPRPHLIFTRSTRNSATAEKPRDALY